MQQRLHKQSKATLNRLFRSASLAPDLGRLQTEAMFGGVWDRPGLTLVNRMRCTIAALASSPPSPPLQRYVGAALDFGMTPAAIYEILLQSSIYAGFKTVEESLALLAVELEQRQLSFPPRPPDEVLLATLCQRTKAMNEPGSDIEPVNLSGTMRYPLTFPPDLDRIRFSQVSEDAPGALIAIASHTALRLPHKVGKLGQSAVDIGLTKTEVIEAVIQTAPYTGFLPAVNALGALSITFGVTPNRPSEYRPITAVLWPSPTRYWLNQVSWFE